MAYFITGSGHLSAILQNLLEYHFNDKAKISTASSSISTIYVEVDANAGYKDEEKRLTVEEVKAGVIGGGFRQGLNGKKFKITVEEVK
jgi:folate-binding Fe-S cluster repair protein YgfZ